MTASVRNDTLLGLIWLLVFPWRTRALQPLGRLYRVWSAVRFSENADVPVLTPAAGDQKPQTECVSSGNARS